MLEVHVRKNIRSTHPPTTHTHTKKQQQQQQKKTKKTHTHTHKHLLWYGAERAAVVSRSCTPARKRRYRWSYSVTTQIRSHKRIGG